MIQIRDPMHLSTNSNGSNDDGFGTDAAAVAIFAIYYFDKKNVLNELNLKNQ